MRLASFRNVMFAFAVCAAPQIVFGQVQTVTSRTMTQTIDGHQLIVTVLSKNSKTEEDAATWWKWGNTTNSTYLFALDRPSNVRFALVFAAGKSGRQATLIYARKDQPPMPLVQRGDATSLGDISPYPHLIISTPDPDWVVNGKTSYRLKLVGDGVAGLESITSTPDGTPDFLREVTPDAAGFPARDETSVIQDPFPNRGYPRYGLNQRAGLSAPFQTWPALMPTFPYIGAGQRRPDWFTSNPNPIYFNVTSGEMQFFPFTGFQTAGMYGINSLKVEKKNFETLFAFYSLRSLPPYADMVIRSRSFPAGDVFGPKPTSLARGTFRYSWKTDDPRLWTYSLGFAGQNLITSNDTSTASIQKNYDSLPKMMTTTAWPAISFVQPMKGYPGSEGIYHYSAQDDRTWASFMPNPPATFVLGLPIFQLDTGLRANGEHTLPLNFRGEYMFGTPRKPQLYRNDLDGLIHLLGAQEGFWYTDTQQYLHTLDLNKDGYIDSYQECQLLDTAQLQTDIASAPISCKSRLIRMSNSAILIEDGNISVKSRLSTPINQFLPVPTTSENWKTFVAGSGKPSITSGHVLDLWTVLTGNISLDSRRTVNSVSFDDKTGSIVLNLKPIPGQAVKLIISNDGSTNFK